MIRWGTATTWKGDETTSPGSIFAQQATTMGDETTSPTACVSSPTSKEREAERHCSHSSSSQKQVQKEGRRGRSPFPSVSSLLPGSSEVTCTCELWCVATLLTRARGVTAMGRGPKQKPEDRWGQQHFGVDGHAVVVVSWHVGEVLSWSVSSWDSFGGAGSERYGPAPTSVCSPRPLATMLRSPPRPSLKVA
jgi:hypothetical protein